MPIANRVPVVDSSDESEDETLANISKRTLPTEARSNAADAARCKRLRANEQERISEIRKAEELERDAREAWKDREKAMSLDVAEAPAAVPATVPAVVPAVVPTVVPAAVPAVVPAVIPATVPAAVPAVVPAVVPTVVPAAVPAVVPAPAAVPTQTNGKEKAVPVNTGQRMVAPQHLAVTDGVRLTCISTGVLIPCKPKLPVRKRGTPPSGRLLPYLHPFALEEVSAIRASSRLQEKITSAKDVVETVESMKVLSNWWCPCKLLYHGVQPMNYWVRNIANEIWFANPTWDISERLLVDESTFTKIVALARVYGINVFAGLQNPKTYHPATVTVVDPVEYEIYTLENKRYATAYKCAVSRVATWEKKWGTAYKAAEESQAKKKLAVDPAPLWAAFIKSEVATDKFFADYKWVLDTYLKAGGKFPPGIMASMATKVSTESLQAKSKSAEVMADVVREESVRYRDHIHSSVSSTGELRANFLLENAKSAHRNFEFSIKHSLAQYDKITADINGLIYHHGALTTTLNTMLAARKSKLEKFRAGILQSQIRQARQIAWTNMADSNAAKSVQIEFSWGERMKMLTKIKTGAGQHVEYFNRIKTWNDNSFIEISNYCGKPPATSSAPPTLADATDSGSEDVLYTHSITREERDAEGWKNAMDLDA